MGCRRRGQVSLSKPPRRANYDRKLARPIKLADGRRLVTLRDAANLFSERSGTVTAWGLLEHAIRLLIAAAESGKRADIEAATDHIQRVLAGRRLL